MPGCGRFPAFLQSCETCSRYRASDLLSPHLKCPARCHPLNFPSARPARRLSEVKLNVHGRQARATRGTVSPGSSPDRSKREPAEAQRRTVTRESRARHRGAGPPRLRASCGVHNSCTEFLGVPYRVPHTNIPVRSRGLREAGSMAPPPDAQRASAEPPGSDANYRDSAVCVPGQSLGHRVASSPISGPQRGSRTQPVERRPSAVSRGAGALSPVAPRPPAAPAPRAPPSPRLPLRASSRPSRVLCAGARQEQRLMI